MKYFHWNKQKNEFLKSERGVSFEEIVFQIEAGKLLGVEENPTRTNQKIYIVEIKGYAFVVPFVENDQEIFLKTIFPSRKYTKKYGVEEE